MMADTRKILLIHLFSNGDCLYATTVARQIKKDFPSCRLTWAISRGCQPMIDNNPDVDDIWAIEMPPGEDKEKIFFEILEEAERQKKCGKYDLVFCSQVLGDNWSHYDGCVRTSIYKCYDKPVTVDKRPVLILKEEEKKKADLFFQQHGLGAYKNVILYECAPLSGQANFTDDFVMSVASMLADYPGTAVILSSARQYPIDKKGVVDGSGLTIRETVALSKHCTMLLGCSSGITWAIHSQSDLLLPSVHLLNKDSYVFNPPSVAMKKAAESVDHLLELYRYDRGVISRVFNSIMTEGFQSAKNRFNQLPGKQFKIYRGIVHGLLRRRKWRLLTRFIGMNLCENGSDFRMIWKIFQGFILFPLDWLLKRKG
jgi:hypothetical protein